MIGLAGGATAAGRHVARTGRYRRWLLGGSALLTAGAAVMATINPHTSLALVAGALGVMGTGVGLLMQNLILVAQNAVPTGDLGAGTSLIAFARGLGGAAGLSGLGAVVVVAGIPEVPLRGR